MNTYNRSKFSEAYTIRLEFGTERPLTEEEILQLLYTIELQIDEPAPLDASESKRAKWSGTFIEYAKIEKLENVNRWKVIPMNSDNLCSECKNDPRDCSCVYCPQCSAISYELSDECQYCNEPMLDPEDNK
jgi:hypothetical protein